ncbi:MAG: DEAD/DEAH box helicase [Elusimicrobiaceae bacterium]|nr:DEAD/DEAH box helicase [Elusimicrobiaceae bacterium]
MSMKDFSILPAFLQDALKRLGITTPTPIQAQAIEPAMQGRDVLGTAQTGTGKTFAFLLPILSRMEKEDGGAALILSPTRELAQQTYEALHELVGKDPRFASALIIGGDNIDRQFVKLARHPRFIIATPGRVIDHMNRKTIDLSDVRYFVLDETDRMLDMGFRDDIQTIAYILPEENKQTLLFSATMPKEITGLAAQYLKEPVRVKIGSVTSTVDLVSQEIICMGVREKLPQLVHELNTRKGSVLVFVRTKHGADRLAKQLKMYGIKANAIHGDLRQNRRQQVMDAFRNGTLRVLVATDVAARGIDVPHIGHVINYDLPQCPEDYIHRIGRTGRAGSVGCAVSFIAGDEDKWREISEVAQFSTPVKLVEKTNDPLPEPKFVPQEEGRSRRGRANTLRRGEATRRARELLESGEVDLPQNPAPARAPRVILATDKLDVPAAPRRLSRRENSPKQAERHAPHKKRTAPQQPQKQAGKTRFGGHNVARVGASKRALNRRRAQENRQQAAPKKGGLKNFVKKAFSKLFGRKKKK